MMHFVRIMDKSPANHGTVQAVAIVDTWDAAKGLADFAREQGDYASFWLASPQTVAVYDAIGKLARGGRSANYSQVARVSGVSRTTVRGITDSLRAQRVIRNVAPPKRNAPSWRQVAP